jgi:FdrA protein
MSVVEDAMSGELEVLLQTPLVVIAVGLRDFAENLKQQDVEVVQVDWTPPAGGDKEMADLLEKLL